MAEESRKYDYKHEMKVPISIIERTSDKPKIKKSLGSLRFKQLLKNAGRLIVILSLISAPVYLLSAFEAHVINVTAHICSPSETHTMGYWKNHCDAYQQYCLPGFVGDIPEDFIIQNCNHAEIIFDAANADIMDDMLRGQLLAMKFNIGCFEIDGDEGEEFPFEGALYNLNELVALADELLRDPSSTREDLEAIKKLLDNLNNKDYIKYCSTPPTWFVDSFGFSSEEPVMTEEITTDDFNQELLLAQMSVDDSEGGTTTEATTTEESFPEEPPVEEPPAEESPTEEPPVEEPPVSEEPPSEEPPAGEETTEGGTTEGGIEDGLMSESGEGESTGETSGETTDESTGEPTGDSTDESGGEQSFPGGETTVEGTTTDGTTDEGTTDGEGTGDVSDTGDTSSGGETGGESSDGTTSQTSDTTSSDTTSETNPTNNTE